MKTFNKKGDRGETSLLYGVRVPKSHPRCEAYGTVDEAVSALGLARSFCKKVDGGLLIKLQKGLFVLGAELATPREQYEKFAARGSAVSVPMVDELEALIDEYEAKTEMPQAFILPGATPGASALDVARAFVRRAERRTVELVSGGEVRNENVCRYLNRMADLLFTLARYEEGELRLYA